MFRTVSICHDVDYAHTTIIVMSMVDRTCMDKAGSIFAILYNCVYMFVTVRFRHSISVLLFPKCNAIVSILIVTLITRRLLQESEWEHWYTAALACAFLFLVLLVVICCLLRGRM